MASRRQFDEETADRILVRYADVVKPMPGGVANGGYIAAIYNGIVSALCEETYTKDLWRRVYRETKSADTKSGLRVYS